MTSPNTEPNTIPAILPLVAHGVEPEFGSALVVADAAAAEEAILTVVVANETVLDVIVIDSAVVDVAGADVIDVAGVDVTVIDLAEVEVVAEDVIGCDVAVVMDGAGDGDEVAVVVSREDTTVLLVDGKLMKATEVMSTVETMVAGSSDASWRIATTGTEIDEKPLVV